MIEISLPIAGSTSNYVYFCGKCGEIWCRIDTGARSDSRWLWEFELRLCEAHGEGFLGVNCHREITQNLPRDLLVRDFLLASKNPTAYFCSGG